MSKEDAWFERIERALGRLPRDAREKVEENHTSAVAAVKLRLDGFIVYGSLSAEGRKAVFFLAENLGVPYDAARPPGRP